MARFQGSNANMYISKMVYITLKGVKHFSAGRWSIVNGAGIRMARADLGLSVADVSLPGYGGLALHRA